MDVVTFVVALVGGVGAAVALFGHPKKPDSSEHHDPDAEISPEEQWALLLRDVDSESTPAAKIAVIRHWLDSGHELTLYEQVYLVEMFDEVSERKEIRQVFAKSYDVRCGSSDGSAARAEDGRCTANRDPRCDGGNCTAHCREHCQSACLSSETNTETR